MEKEDEEVNRNYPPCPDQMEMFTGKYNNTMYTKIGERDDCWVLLNPTNGVIINVPEQIQMNYIMSK